MSNLILAVAFVLATAIVAPVAADDATQDAPSSGELEESLKKEKLITAIKEEQAKQDEADQRSRKTNTKTDD